MALACLCPTVCAQTPNNHMPLNTVEVVQASAHRSITERRWMGHVSYKFGGNSKLGPLPIYIAASPPRSLLHISNTQMSDIA